MLEIIEKQILSSSEHQLRSKRWDQGDMSEMASAMKNRYTPATFDYFLELNPSFITQYKNLDNIAEYPVVMLRDGFLGIFYFFVKNPKPYKELKTLFLIPKKFSSLVPKFWKENVLFYSIKNIHQSHPINHVYIYGALTSDNFIFNTIAQSVEKISSLIPTKARVSLMSTFKHQYFFEYKNEIEYALSFLKEMYKKRGFDLECIDEYKTEIYESADQSCGFINIDDDHFIINDDYLSHYFSSRGASSLRENSAIEENVIKTIKLSPYHSLYLETADEKAFTFNIIEEMVKLKLHSIPINYLNHEFYEHAKKIFKTNFLIS